MQNVVHFNNPDGALTHAAMAAELITHWITPLLALHNNNFVWVQLEITELGSGPSLTDTFPIASGQGSQAGDAAPPFVSAVIKLSSAVPGRKGRGRIFLPGLSIGTFGDRGRLTPGSYSGFQTLFLNGWRAKFIIGGSGPLQLVITNRTPTAHADWVHVTGLDVRNYAGVQRRRNYFVGM